MRHGELPKVIFVGAAVIAGVVAVFVWWFSDLLGLDHDTGGRVLAGVVASIILLCMMRRIGFSGAFAVPVFLVVVWISFWPALNYWGARAEFPYLLDDYPGFDAARHGVWWAAWYSKLAGGIVAALIPLWVRKVWRASAN